MISWVVPLPSNSHHQDYYVFSRGSQPKPSFATGILGGGTTQVISPTVKALETGLTGQLDLIHLGSWTSSTWAVGPHPLSTFSPIPNLKEPTQNLLGTPRASGGNFPDPYPKTSPLDPRLQNQREPNSTKPLTPASSQSLIACNPNSNLLGKKVKISPSTATLHIP